MNPGDPPIPTESLPGSLQWWWNGRLCAESEVRLSPRDRGIRYGDGVYDTIRVHRGHPFRLGEHLDRMARGLAVLGLELEPRAAFPAPAIARLIAANIGAGEGRLRLMVTRGPDVGNHLPAAVAKPTVLGVAEPLPPATPISQPEPARLALVRETVRRPGAWSSLKSLSHLSYVLAAAEARACGADDGLLIAGDRVLEATAANLFCVMAGIVRTPAADAGLLAGVTRDTVIELARRRGLPVAEGELRLAELEEADEIFLTGSVIGIRPVGSIDAIRPDGPVPGPVTVALQAAYAACVETAAAMTPGDPAGT